jgi:hypothetical protein
MTKIVRKHIISEEKLDIFDEYTSDDWTKASKDSAFKYGIIQLDQLSESIIERAQV